MLRLRELERLLKMTPGERCHATRMQDCHCCERGDCGDNMSPLAVEARALRRKVKELTPEAIRLRLEVTVMLEAPDNVRAAMAAALRLGGTLSDAWAILQESTGRPQEGHQRRLSMNPSRSASSSLRSVSRQRSPSLPPMPRQAPAEAGAVSTRTTCRCQRPSGSALLRRL